MGFWGSFVVCRTETPMMELSSVARYGVRHEWHARWADGWQIGQFPFKESADDEAPVQIGELAEETGAPTLKAFVLDSDSAGIDGYSTAHGPWSACLARASMQDYLDIDGVQIDSEFSTPELATEQAVHWSHAAGSTPDPDRLRTLFERERGVVFVEPVFFSMLEAMGLRTDD